MLFFSIIKLFITLANECPVIKAFLTLRVVVECFVCIHALQTVRAVQARCICFAHSGHDRSVIKNGSVRTLHRSTGRKADYSLCLPLFHSLSIMFSFSFLLSLSLFYSLNTADHLDLLGDISSLRNTRQWVLRGWHFVREIIAKQTTLCHGHECIWFEVVPGNFAGTRLWTTLSAFPSLSLSLSLSLTWILSVIYYVTFILWLWYCCWTN